MHQIPPYSQHFTEKVNVLLSASLTGVACRKPCGWTKYYHDRQILHVHKKDAHIDHHLSAGLTLKPSRAGQIPPQWVSLAQEARTPIPSSLSSDTRPTCSKSLRHHPNPPISKPTPPSPYLPAAQQAQADAGTWDTSTSSTLQTRPFRADVKIFRRWIVPPRTQWWCCGLFSAGQRTWCWSGLHTACWGTRVE